MREWLPYSIILRNLDDFPYGAFYLTSYNSAWSSISDISILTHEHKYLGPGEFNLTDDSFSCEKAINWEQKTKIESNSGISLSKIYEIIII